MSKELTVCRELTNPNFDSYRYCRDLNYKITSEPIADNETLQTFQVGSEDFSYCHMSMANSINNLYQCPFNTENVYYITNSGKIFMSFPKVDNGELKIATKLMFVIPGK